MVEDIRRLRCVKTTQIEMLQARGFDTSIEAHLMGKDDAYFRKYYTQLAISNNMDIRQALANIYVNKSKPSDRVLVCYNQINKSTATYGITEFQILLATLDANDMDHVILVSDKKITSAVSKLIESISAKRIEIFYDYELVVNITKHVMVPLHVPLNQDETEVVLKSVGVPPHMFPGIPLTDPVVRYYGLLPGTMIRIYRFNIYSVGIITREIYYRIVSRAAPTAK